MKKSKLKKKDKRKPAKITDAILAGARSKRAPKHEPFAIAEPPPAAVPRGHKGLAMDSALAPVAAWANQNVVWSAFAEGQAFLGYPYLSELAQRPEYRVISETIATEATRKWIKLQSAGTEDKTDKIKELEAELKRLNVQEAFRELAEQDGFFGRSHLYIDLGTTDDRNELMTPIGTGRDKITKTKVKKGSVKRIKTVEAIWCYPANYNATNPLKPDWYRPSTWFAMATEIHASRLLTFVGREVPDLLKPAYSFGGLSMSQMAKPYVDNWLRTRQSVSDIIQAFSVFVLATDMSATLGEGGDQIFRRADLFNLVRDNRGLMMVDKATEDFKNVSASLSSLDKLQAQAQEHMASVSRIPLVKLLGIQPAGLNASSEGELESFDDTINAFQEKFFRPNLTRVIDFAMVNIWGEADPDIGFIFEPLTSLSDKEKAEVEKLEAERDQILIDTGVVSPAESRARVAADPDAGFSSLDVDDVPDLADEETDGLEPRSEEQDNFREAAE